VKKRQHCLCLSVCLCVPMSVCQCLCLFVPVCASVYVSACACIPLCLCLALPVSVSVLPCLCLYMSCLACVCVSCVTCVYLALLVSVSVLPVSGTSNVLQSKNNALFGHNSRLNNKVAVSIEYGMFSVLVDIAGTVRVLSSGPVIYIYIYIYIQDVTGGKDLTSGECCLGQTITI